MFRGRLASGRTNDSVVPVRTGVRAMVPRNRVKRRRPAPGGRGAPGPSGSPPLWCRSQEEVATVGELRPSLVGLVTRFRLEVPLAKEFPNLVLLKKASLRQKKNHKHRSEYNPETPSDKPGPKY